MSPGATVAARIDVGGHATTLWGLEMPDNATDFELTYTHDHEITGDVVVYICSSDSNLGVYGSILLKSVTIDGRGVNPFV